MDFLTDNTSNLNWLAVIVAALTVFPIGFVWYNETFGFGKRWAKLVGLKPRDMNSGEGMGKTFGLLAVLALATSIVLGCLLQATGTSGFWDSVVFGLIIGVVIRGGTHLMHNGFAKRSDQLTLIDAAHDTLAITVICAVLGVWT